MGRLDDKFRASLNLENIKKEFDFLKQKKTDIISGKVQIARGCDKVGYEEFEENLRKHATIICTKGCAGKYLFSPFREKETPKPPYGQHQLAEAKKNDKIRILSISTIQDTLFQKLLADVLSGYAENIFAEKIDLHSYGYREGKSSKMAVRKIRRHIDEGYLYVLDGDIKGFFDEINHALLTSKMQNFFGIENELVQKFLYRFIHVDKIPVGKMKEYVYPSRCEKRLCGIPQGGVLSGLLANVFLYDFDLYVVYELMPKYAFKYFRYADDFVLLFRDGKHINEVHSLLKDFLEKEKLELHPIGEKTKRLDLSEGEKDTLDFLGFGISPRYLRVKKDNLKKFKDRIEKTLKDIEMETVNDLYFQRVVENINRKIVGLEDIIESNDGLCPVCKCLIKKRSWLGYFMMTNDVRQLRNIDTMIRNEIYRDYHRRTKKHLRKKELRGQTYGKLKSVVKTYYEYRKQVLKHGKKGYCNCDRHFDPESCTIKVIADNFSN